MSRTRLHLVPPTLAALAPLLSGPSCGGSPSPYTPPATPADDDDAVGDDDVAGDDDTAPEGGDGASIASASFPESLACGVTSMATVVARNTGTTVWTHEDGYKLGAVDDHDDLFGPDTRVWLPEGVAIAPGEEFAFDVPLRGVVGGSFTTDWRMVHEGVRWFGESVSADVDVACGSGPGGEGRPGMVRLDGLAFVDDDGPFAGLGASLFWAAWGYRHDRTRLEANLQFLADHGYDSFRALGVVGDPSGPDYWDGREIDDAWPDYDAVIAGLTDLAYDTYGLRVQWTLIGDGQVSVPGDGERYALADRFLAMSQGREHKILFFEIANESWQNGFPGDDGVASLRDLTRYLQDRTDILVASSAPDGHECADTQRLYGDGVGDLATLHFDREIGFVDGPWRPVRQPWEHLYCDGVPPGVNNEPIGPGASVNTEHDPSRLLAGAVVTWLSGLPHHVFHSGAGVRGDSDLWDMAGADIMGRAAQRVAPDVANWSRRNAHWADAPFQVFATSGGTEHADTMWPDLGGDAEGVVRAYGAVAGQDFVVFPIGVQGTVRMAARRPMTWQMTDPMTGDLRGAGNLAAGESIEVSGASIMLVTGRFLD